LQPLQPRQLSIGARRLRVEQLPGLVEKCGAPGPVAQAGPDRRQPEQDFQLGPGAERRPLPPYLERLLQLALRLAQVTLRGQDGADGQVGVGPFRGAAEAEAGIGGEFSGLEGQLLGLRELAGLHREHGHDGRGRQAQHGRGRGVKAGLLRMRGGGPELVGPVQGAAQPGPGRRVPAGFGVGLQRDRPQAGLTHRPEAVESEDGLQNGS